MDTKYVQNILSHYLKNTSLPEKISFNESYWAIYITLYGKSEFIGKLLACQHSKNQDVSEAIHEALIKCFKDDRFALIDDYEILVTVVKESVALNPETFVLGKHAISCERAFYKETVAITSQSNLEELVCKIYQKANATEELPIWQHESTSYLHGVGRLEFAHKPVESLENLDTQMDLAGDFLARMGHEEGLFYYSFNPVREKFSDENNMIRQLATLWVFCKWVNLRNKREHADFCHRSLDLVYKTYSNNFFLKEISIAHLGFFLLATLESQASKEIRSLQDELVQRIVSQQNENGSFRTIVGSDEIYRGINYYPYEAMLALKEYGLKRGVSIPSIDKAYPFYLDHFRKSPNLSIVPWFSQVYGAELSKELFDSLLLKQQDNGSFSKNGDVSACVFTEALAVSGRVEELKKSLRFILSLQYQPEDMYYIKPHARKFALGGIRESLTSCELRIDYTQHFINACTLARKVL